MLIFIFIFIAGTLLTAAAYLYISTNSHYDSLPLAVKTGSEARAHFGLISSLGGLLAMGCYAIISLLDPYGNHAAEKAEKLEKQKRALLMEEIRKNRARRQ